jgi:hypothetical protein
MSWKFADPPNLAVIADRAIFDRDAWIAFVSHDEDDGGWQFHSREPLSEANAAVVSLRNVVERDASIGELADLPLGWQAQRTDPNGPWLRGKTA